MSSTTVNARPTFEFTFYDLLARNLWERGNHPAVVENGCEITYSEIARRAEALAAWLERRGVRRGDRVAIHLHKCSEEVVATFAVAYLGAVFVNVYHQSTVRQLNYVIRDCGTRIAIVDSRCARELASSDLPEELEHVIVKGHAPDHAKMTSWSEVPTDIRTPRTRCIDRDLAAILYTSGSSGQPKGVMLTHTNLIQGARCVACYLENTGEDRVLGLLPLSFDYGLSQLTTMCLVGGTVVLPRAPMPSEIVKTVVQDRVTGFAGIPPIWVEVVRFLLAEPARLPHLRYVTNSGGAIPTNILGAMPTVFGDAKIYLMYGLTEAFRSTYLPPEKFREKAGSMGVAIPNNDVFVVDPEKGLCGPGEQGELIHRGSLISAGYWGKPEETAARIKPCPHLKHLIGDEKVLYSGDLVRLDDEGFLWFVSRADAMIKCSGVRISPTEVEDVIYQSKLVRDVVAFGAPDDLQGQVVHVVVSSLDMGPVSEAEMVLHCKKHMPPYMVPQTVHQWPGEMPRTGSGKIDRVAVVKAFPELRRPA